MLLLCEKSFLHTPLDNRVLKCLLSVVSIYLDILVSAGMDPFKEKKKKKKKRILFFLI